MRRRQEAHSARSDGGRESRTLHEARPYAAGGGAIGRGVALVDARVAGNAVDLRNIVLFKRNTEANKRGSKKSAHGPLLRATAARQRGTHRVREGVGRLNDPAAGVDRELEQSADRCNATKHESGPNHACSFFAEFGYAPALCVLQTRSVVEDCAVIRSQVNSVGLIGGPGKGSTRHCKRLHERRGEGQSGTEACGAP
jgi:hypothetical protein